MTRQEVVQAVASLRANGWVIIDVIETKDGHAVIAADSTDDHMTYNTLFDALHAGLA